MIFTQPVSHNCTVVRIKKMELSLTVIGALVIRSNNIRRTITI